MALLIGYGAAAVNPYLALDAIDDMISEGLLEGVTPAPGPPELHKGGVQGRSQGDVQDGHLDGGLLHRCPGLRGDRPRRGADRRVLHRDGSRIGGVGLSVLAAEVATRHRRAHEPRPTERAHRELEVGGEYQWRREGEFHLFNPKTVFKLQHATRSKRYGIFKEYSSAVDDQAEKLGTLRGLLRLKPAPGGPIPLDEVEPISAIMARFSTGRHVVRLDLRRGARDTGHRHEPLGGRSNTGEGGEDADRFTPDENGDLRRSAIKQVASGRFGVTSEYLVNADDIQIKIAQGAKPGEGGQLPGNKIHPWIARTRKSTPGVGLISPPPHHDIYSIEDIAQLIHDLKNVQSAGAGARQARGRGGRRDGGGRSRQGALRCRADLGPRRRYGRSPADLAEARRHPMGARARRDPADAAGNGLRDRIVVQVDGQLKTGRDVVIAALLGAEEYGFASAPLVVSGCIMMRVCHLDTCPVGIATQNPELRAKFQRQARVRRDFFEYVAEEVRELLPPRVAFAERPSGGSTSRDRGGGRALEGGGARPLPGARRARRARHGRQTSEHACRTTASSKALDHAFIGRLRAGARGRHPGLVELPDHATWTARSGRSSGPRSAGATARAGLPDDTIRSTFRGSAGQSFGAFLPRGVTMRLVGDANDYFGKGLSGGRLVVRPPEDSPFVGRGGDHRRQRDPLRRHRRRGVHPRSGRGALLCPQLGRDAVVEGVGDHGCEYMTGGDRSGARADRAQLRGGYVRRYRVRVRPRAHVRQRVNPEMVDVEPLDPEDSFMVRTLVERHGVETESAVAARLLQKWDTEVLEFVKVMPRDYRRILEATRQAEAQGRSVDQAVMEAAHG